MKRRCFKPNRKAFKDYGGRGITVCSGWLEYESFHAWAMANGYTDNLTIERKDVNGDYCPDNCEWIPLVEQNQNTRKSRLITYNGQTMNMSRWAKTIGLEEATLWSRLKKGWSVEKALTTPLRRAA
jgi:hypothetical protein